MSMGVKKNEWYEVVEAKRVYIFPNGQNLAIKDVRRFKVSDNHTHFVEDKDGHKVIVRNTWVGIEIDGNWAI